MEVNKKILIVEDETIIKALKVKFINAGFQVMTARDGADGMEKLSKDRPDIVLLDLVTPNVDGFGFLKLLRADRDNFDIPVMVFSNLGGLKDINRAKSYGVVGYIIKAQVTLEELVEKVRDYLSPKQAHLG